MVLTRMQVVPMGMKERKKCISDEVMVGVTVNDGKSDLI